MTPADTKRIAKAIVDIRLWLMFEVADDFDPTLVDAINVLHNAACSIPEVKAELQATRDRIGGEA